VSTFPAVTLDVRPLVLNIPSVDKSGKPLVRFETILLPPGEMIYARACEALFERVASSFGVPAGLLRPPHGTGSQPSP
jgi:hypothetical protein